MNVIFCFRFAVAVPCSALGRRNRRSSCETRIFRLRIRFLSVFLRI